jgi:cobalt-zinc-cadmium efflux system outer membrane protein
MNYASLEKLNCLLMGNKNRIFLLIAFCLMMNTGNLYAQEVFTLSQILDRVEEHHPMLKMYNQKIAAYDAYAEGTSSWMAPMVGVGTFMTPYPNQEIMHENEKGAWMFSVEQEIPNPSKQKANKDYFNALRQVEEKAFFVQRQTIRSEVKELYYKSIANLNQQRVIKENLSTINAMLTWTKQQYAINNASLAQVYKTESQVETVASMLAMLQGDFNAMHTRLKLLMQISDSVKLDTIGVVKYIHDYTFKFQEEVKTIRSIQQLDQTIIAMQTDQDRQRMQRRPDFKIRFDHMQPIGNMPKQYSAMAMVSIPIAPWSSKMYKAEIKGMQFDIEAMKMEREAVSLETLSMVNGMVVSLQEMQKQLHRYQDKVLPALKRNADLTQSMNYENQSNLMMVLESWEAYTMMQEEYWKKWNEYVNMLIQYEKVLDL